MSSVPGTNKRKSLGRKKIPIQFIEDDAVRKNTFRKRTKGLFKKAFELDKLCGACLRVEVVSRDCKKQPYGYETGRPLDYSKLPPGMQTIFECLVKEAAAAASDRPASAAAADTPPSPESESSSTIEEEDVVETEDLQVETDMTVMIKTSDDIDESQPLPQVMHDGTELSSYDQEAFSGQGFEFSDGFSLGEESLTEEQYSKWIEDIFVDIPINM